MAFERNESGWVRAFGSAANLYLNSRESSEVLAHPVGGRFPGGWGPQTSPKAARKDKGESEEEENRKEGEKKGKRPKGKEKK